MKLYVLFLTAIIATSISFAKEPPKTKSLKHVTSINKRSDGQFDVLCMDGLVQVKTEQELLYNDVCEHISEDVSKWSQESEGPEVGMRFCDFKTTTFKNSGVVSFLSVEFESPCNSTPILANSCSAQTCNIFIGSNEYSFDFSQAPYDLEITRLSDNTKFKFK